MTLALALYSIWMLSLLVAKPEHEVRKLTKRELLREAMSGDAPAAGPAAPAASRRDAPDLVPEPVAVA